MKKIFANEKLFELTNSFLWNNSISGNIFLIEKEDFAAILDIETKAFDKKYYDSLLTYKSLDYLLNKSNAIILTYKIDTSVIGYAQVNFKKNSVSARFYSLVVKQEFQSKGFEKTLFSSVETLCKILSLSTLLLEVREDNVPLRYRYKKRGYIEYRRVDKYYPDGCAAIKMKRVF